MPVKEHWTDGFREWLVLFLIILLTTKACWHLKTVKEQGYTDRSDEPIGIVE
jgi:hypothetical protein